MNDGQAPKSVRIAAVGDIHCTRDSRGQLHELFVRATESADVLLLAGDLTDYGLAEEAHVLAGELAGAQLPVVAVLGNHDFESGTPAEVASILKEAGVRVLDGDAVEIKGIGFAGAKGFGGGFGAGALGSWGEPAVKAFVQAALDEALKLETALARLRMEQRVVLLHYSPVARTVEGEPEPIYPFLGSSRLEEPIDRFATSVVFHGHAHHGTLEGSTRGGTPVYNVSLPLLRALGTETPFHVVELPAAEPPDVLAEPAARGQGVGSSA
ncbi:MAG TPA: metallophosphoesterase [Candidatus Limnocylindria bacterium]|nr:metallophosphoesterase [Candidatus Limnocylindria bacterium]